MKRNALQSATATLPADAEPSRKRWAIPALLIALVLATYWPLLTAEFTIWDDYQAVVTQEWLNPPTLAHVWQFWSYKNTFMDIWIPLTYTIWSGLAAMSYVPTADVDTGAHLNPWIFHGANVAVHAASVLLVFAILKRMVRRPWAAAAGAALFAVHPVQVETVGWVAGMKDLLAGCMGLLAVWQYLQFAQPPEPPAGEGEETARPLRREFHYVIALFAFILAMLAKPSGIVVPGVIGVLDLWLIRRPLKNVIVSLGPWLLLTIPIILLGHHAQPAAELSVPPIARPMIASDALAFYFYKLFVPVRLAITYNRAPHVVLSHHWQWYTWIVPVAAIAIAWPARRKFPWLLAGLGVYWAAVFPVLGLIPFDFQAFSTVADHYLYLAMLGPAIAVAFLLATHPGKTTAFFAAAILAFLAARSCIQSFTWRDSVSLFTNAARVNPYSCAAYNNLAEAYRSKHEFAQSAEIFAAGLAYNPDCVALRVGYASLLVAIDQPDDARRQFQIAAQTASGPYVRLIRESLTRLNTTPPPSQRKPAANGYLTPATSPIK